MSKPLADLSSLPPIAHQRGGDPGVLFAELKHIIGQAINNHPRSLQTAIGPSEIGEPCARRVAYKITGTPEARTFPPAWRPTVGTACHAWVEEVLAEWNAAHHDDNGASRFLIETRISAGPMAGGMLDGNCDVYDRITGTAIDWKFVGPSSWKAKRAAFNAGRGPGPQYRTQLHTYGYAYTLRGLPVDQVMLIAGPVAGELDDFLMWTEPYDETVATTAMARVDRIHALTQAFGPAAYTVTNGALAAAGAGHLADPGGQPGDPAIGVDPGGCRFCPWLDPAAASPAQGCPGKAAEAGPSGLHDLIAS